MQKFIQQCNAFFLQANVLLDYVDQLFDQLLK